MSDTRATQDPDASQSSDTPAAPPNNDSAADRAARASATVDRDQSQNGAGNVQPCALAWIEVVLVDDDGDPVGGMAYKITAPDGQDHTGALDGNGFARVDGIPPGTCQITFPTLDRSVWHGF